MSGDPASMLQLSYEEPKTFINIAGNTWMKIINSIKKHLALLIIFILIGNAIGLYLAKIVYDFRMKEISAIGGYIHNGKIYDVKLRP